MIDPTIPLSVQAFNGDDLRQGDSVVDGVYALLLSTAVVCFAAACIHLYLYLPSVCQQGITYDNIKGTWVFWMFLLSAVVAIPTTVKLLMRCIRATHEVSFYAWTVVLIGGVLSFVYIVFGMNMISRAMAIILSKFFS
ncbi:hypothetical protein [Ferrimonas senticii]|uniref:hypothetical protein n=1 Tax=Ferrimonas senticii TaxID=394566 RepID=UPI0003FD8174|nr:hypothetical protein [Ferrimonas senticii]